MIWDSLKIRTHSTKKILCVLVLRTGVTEFGTPCNKQFFTDESCFPFSVLMFIEFQCEYLSCSITSTDRVTCTFDTFNIKSLLFLIGTRLLRTDRQTFWDV